MYRDPGSHTHTHHLWYSSLVARIEEVVYRLREITCLFDVFRLWYFPSQKMLIINFEILKLTCFVPLELITSVGAVFWHLMACSLYIVTDVSEISTVSIFYADDGVGR